MDCVLVSEVHICFCGGMNSLVRFACLGYVSSKNRNDCVTMNIDLVKV